jgi:UDP:flavonoid glycosyltransferase YjiC (YdhE family)
MRGLRIDAVLANHAPVPLIAARALGLPRGQFGASFVVPPAVTPFPGFQPQLNVAEEVLRNNEAKVLGALNQALERLRLAPLERLQQIIEGSHSRIFGYAELDAYGAQLREPGSHLGVADQSYGDAPPWSAQPGPRVFAYLRAFNHLEPLMKALQASRLNLLVRVADMAPEKLQPFLRPGMVITGRSVHLRQAAEQCDAMIHYGPDGSTAEMLLAGKPGLLLPIDVEKVLVAWRAQQVGAVLVSEGRDAQKIGGLLEQLVEDDSLRRSAETFAARYRQQDRSQILPDYARDFLSGL